MGRLVARQAPVPEDEARRLTIIGAVLALIAYGSTIRKWRPQHFITLIALVLVLAAFGYEMKKSLVWANRRFGPELYKLEEKGPQ